jgi:hypothetical protein
MMARAVITGLVTGLLYDGYKVKPVIRVIARLMQGQIEVFAE